MRWKRSDLAVGLCALLIAFGADAGVRRFDMTTDASSNAEGEIEIEGWLDFGRPSSAVHHTDPTVSNAMFWLGLRFGLLDSLELASFLVLEKRTFVELQRPPMLNKDGKPIPQIHEEQSGIMMWVSELRWRPVEVGKWPIDLFLQFQFVHWFERYHPVQFRLTLGGSKNIGRFLIAANASYWDSPRGQSLDDKPEGTRWAWWEFTLGVSANLIEADGWVPSMNLGLEGWAFIPRSTSEQRFHVHNHLLHGGGIVVGPTLSLARGRLWLTGHLGFPVLVPYFDENGVMSPDGPRSDFRQLVGRIMLGINL